jgi:hypothetical protein
MANAHHKYPKAGETKINKLEIKNGKIISKDTNNIVSHIEADDANSLYPSSTCSKINKENPYTNNRMYMPARLISYLSNEGLDSKVKILKIINNRSSDKLFVVSVKGSIRAADEERINGITINGQILYGNDADEY